MEITRLPAAEVLASLQSSTAGLDDAEASRRRLEFGPNRIEAVRGQPLWLRLLSEFTHFFALILWVAAALAFFAEFVNPGAGMRQLGLAIVAVILINGIFSFFQEYRAEQALDALRRLLPATTKVIRGGELRTLPAATLVPGDLVLLEAGDNVPADCRLIAASGLRVNFATLTGESMPVTLTAAGMPAERSLESKNVVLAGTSLVSGSGTAVVFATGMRTEFGRIAHLTQTVGEAGSPLQREIARLSRLVAVLALLLGVVFFGIGVAVGLPLWHSAMFAIGIIVANVPEGLLPTVTLALAMGTQRMARRNALVRHLPSVETLGATTVICSDKTGTLTQNSMSVQQAFVERMESPTDDLARFNGEEHLLRSLRHCHNLKRGRNGAQETWLGDPMELALRAFGERGVVAGAERVVEEIPFDSDLRRMSVVVELAGRRWVYCKGAPEAVLDLCSKVQSATGEVDLDAARRQRVIDAQARMAGQGLRVLGFAYRQLQDGGDSAQAGMTFSGLVGLRDPPRPEVRAALERCHSAGIKVIMVTGDHPQTAVAIGREIGLVQSGEPLVIHGDRLRRMSDAQLRISLDAPEILFTRVTADQKLRVVEALKAKGHVVAVTGD
ncbi:MAG TPA: cation-transporting P-type ATPase, partial [Steroidobacteraceae bacterium]